MKPKTKRRLLDIMIMIVTLLTLDIAGAGWWALLAFPFGLWNFYDGMTQNDLAG